MREYLNPRNTKEYRELKREITDSEEIYEYWEDKPDVNWRLPEELKDLFDEYALKCIKCDDQGYYIRANDLYFTFKGKKYSCSIYNRECVEKFVEEIARKLAVRGCSKMCYAYGELD